MLETLCLDNTELEELPETLKELTAMKLLNLRGNKLELLPQGLLENMGALKTLILSSNR